MKDIIFYSSVIFAFATILYTVYTTLKFDDKEAEGL